MTAEPRDVEEIRGAALALATQSAMGYEEALEALMRMAEWRSPAEAAAADRENAELRGEVERLEHVAHFLRSSAEVDVRKRAAERDDLRAQLAAAQAQLAEEIAWRNRLLARLEAVRAAMNYPDVRCLCGHESALHAEGGERRCTETADRASWHCPCRTFHPISIPTRLLDAALSAAPQPEPDDGCAECTESGTRNCVAGCKPEPPASAEPTGRSD